MKFQFMNPDELKAKLEAGEEAVVVDIRDPGSFSAGSIKGSQPLNNDNVQLFVEQTDKSLPVVVCCYHGNSSQSAAQFLAEQGFSDVYSLQGGFELWKTVCPEHCS
ncbi:MAG: thiosulfate sulfurtransferase GlpE [Oceanospirillum sp.]|nr:thiosulfate sulfurtransferase GlpE [Oceanospirillum sp.]MDX1397945.1 thiosulfate sulfurtransferase GlpE [Oceanospirillum sp.]